MKFPIPCVRRAIVAVGFTAAAHLVPCAAAADDSAASAEQHANSDAASIRDGVFTEAQAKRGEALYPGPCGRCHGWKLDGAPDDPDMPPTPPVAGAKFLRNWDGRSIASLLEYTRATMPENNPGFLSGQEYADIIAYMLMASGAPPGEQEISATMSLVPPIVIEKLR